MLMAIIIAWIVCGILAYGGSVAYFQREFPLIAKNDAIPDRIFAFLLSFLGGPIGLLTVGVVTRFKHGWML